MRTPYAKLLEDPRWQRKRLEIMQRDGWACVACSTSTRTLNVHHKIYRAGLLPWEYAGSDLVTLCRDCHEGQHATEIGPAPTRAETAEEKAARYLAMRRCRPAHENEAIDRNTKRLAEWMAKNSGEHS